MWSAVALAVSASVVSSAGKVIQARASKSLPRFSTDRRVLLRYLRSLPFVAGVVVDVLGGLSMAKAVSMAPVSVVQPVGACGIVVFAISDSNRLRFSDLVSVASALLGALCVAASSDGGVGKEEKIASGTFFIAAITLVLAAGAAWRRSGKAKKDDVIWDGIHAGTCFGVSAACARAGFLASDLAGRRVYALVGLLSSIAMSASGAVGQAHALRDGGAAVGGTCVSAASVASSSLVGSMALGETVPKDPIHLAAKAVGLILIALSTASLSASKQEPVLQ